MSAYLPYLQSLVGVALVGYAVYLAGRRAVGLLPNVAKPSAVPVDDVRIVSDLATRLRGQGKTAAVDIALKLHAELLKPEVPTP